MPTPTTEFSIFDGREFVTYTPASAAAVADVPALRRPLSRSSQRNIERYVELAATDVIFYLDAAALAGVGLQAGDSVTDAESMIYVVLFVERQMLGNTIAVDVRSA